MTEHHLQNNERILLIKLAGIGDFVLSLPAMKTLSLRNKVTLLSTGRVEGLAKQFPYFKEIYLLKEPFFSPQTLFPNLRTILSLRKKNFEAGVNLHAVGSLRGSWVMALLFFLLHVKKSIGWNQKGRGFFFTVKVSYPENESIHERERYNNFVQDVLGCRALDEVLEPHISKGAEEKIDRLFQKKEFTGCLVGFHLGGNKRECLWPIDRFVNVAKALESSYDATIFVTGTKKEMSLYKAFQDRLPFRVKNFCGTFSLEELPALLKRAQLFVSNDTGVMHLAAFLGIPLVAIFGPGSERRFYPVHQNDQMRIIHQQSISSIDDISEEEVIEASMSLLKNRGISPKKGLPS